MSNETPMESPSMEDRAKAWALKNVKGFDLKADIPAGKGMVKMLADFAAEVVAKREAEIGNVFEKVQDTHWRMVQANAPTGQTVHACDLCDALNDLRAAIAPRPDQDSRQKSGEPSLERLRARANRAYGCECADCCEKVYQEAKQ